MTLSDRLERLRQPEYTGENRCPPCTVVNVVIAGVLAALAFTSAQVAGGDAIVSAAPASATFALSAVVIYLRGYLVPGTPWAARRYLPESLRRRFETGPPDGVATADELDVELLQKGAGAEPRDGNDSRTPDGAEFETNTESDAGNGAETTE